ncbi:MAG: hypothetical protein DDT27_00902 [Dehalococcoidia bacterium]|nr:hypothetical protein [Chloroflexota bacterium]MBT9162344.1 hypothetical protein [Chloroflexota bacterium]
MNFEDLKRMYDEKKRLYSEALAKIRWPKLR